MWGGESLKGAEAGEEMDRQTHDSPVDRLMPAKQIETNTASNK